MGAYCQRVRSEAKINKNMLLYEYNLCENFHCLRVMK